MRPAVPDRVGCLGFACAVDDAFGQASLGEASGAGAVIVVIEPVSIKVVAERGQLGKQRACKCRPPALPKDSGRLGDNERVWLAADTTY